MHPGIEVFAISGGSDVIDGDYLHVAKVFGAIRVLQKPLDIEALVAAVEERLRVK